MLGLVSVSTLAVLEADSAEAEVVVADMGQKIRAAFVAGIVARTDKIAQFA